MAKHVAVPAVPGIDLSFRPRTYFGPVPLETHLLSRVAGQERRELLRRRLASGNLDLPLGLIADPLDEEDRAALGRIHPAFMGGEYLPRFLDNEVEIARISLQSVTADQISVRARRLVGRIGYRIVDEYPEFSKYVCLPASSVSPLSLGELITLMESAREGGSIVFPILGMNSQYSTPAELATFVTVTSDFYTDLQRYYHALIGAWLEQRAREKSDESRTLETGPARYRLSREVRATCARVSRAPLRCRSLGGSSSRLARQWRSALGEWLGLGLTEVQSARLHRSIRDSRQRNADEEA